MVHLGCKGFNQEDTSLQRSLNGLASTEQKCDGMALGFLVWFFLRCFVLVHNSKILTERKTKPTPAVLCKSLEPSII